MFPLGLPPSGLILISLGVSTYCCDQRQNRALSTYMVITDVAYAIFIVRAGYWAKCTQCEERSAAYKHQLGLCQDAEADSGDEIVDGAGERHGGCTCALCHGRVSNANTIRTHTQSHRHEENRPTCTHTQSFVIILCLCLKVCLYVHSVASLRRCRYVHHVLVCLTICPPASYVIHISHA